MRVLWIENEEKRKKRGYLLHSKIHFPILIFADSKHIATRHLGTKANEDISRMELMPLTVRYHREKTIYATTMSKYKNVIHARLLLIIFPIPQPQKFFYESLDSSHYPF